MRFSFSFPSTSALFLMASTLLGAAGCANATDDATAPDAASAGLTAATPITLGNFHSHPKIREIRAEVAAVNAAELTTVERETSCPDEDAITARAKSTDGAGRIRKLLLTNGGSDGAIISTYHYDAAGRLRFAFDVYETAPANGTLYVSEYRAYFDAAGARIFDVMKSGVGTTARPPNMDRAPLQIPDPDGVSDVDPQVATDPAAYYDAKVVCAS